MVFYHGGHEGFHGDSLCESLCSPCILRVLRGKNDGGKHVQFDSRFTYIPEQVS